MLSETGCDGVVIGRGCLGRPWFFAELDAALAGLPVPAPPTVAEVCALVREHAALLVEGEGERMGLLSMRKHVRWYFHDVTLGGELRRALVAPTSLVELERVLEEVAATGRAPDGPARPRGPSAGPRRVALPDGWLDAALDPSVPEDPVDAIGG